MRKIILSMMVSIDGFMEGPEHDISWHVWSEEMNYFMRDFFANIDTILLGRHTYELMLNYWPNAASEDPIVREYMNGLPKIVVSRTLEQVEWKSSLLRENIFEEINRLKQKEGKDMVLFGGSTLASYFINMHLIDEYQLIVNPRALGKGTPLFGKLADRLNFKLLESRPFECGNIMLRYVKKEPNNDVQSELDNAFSQLLQLISSLSEAELNEKLSERSWSAGQVGDHLSQSYNVIELLQGKTAPTVRGIDEKVSKLRSIFLDFSIKMQSPEFIIPSDNEISKDELANALREKTTTIVNFSKHNDLSETCLDFELPGIGPMTKLEWMYFITYHTQRHINQLKKITMGLKKTHST